MSPHHDFFVFESNRVVAASAGTGKTFRLAGIAVHALMGASRVLGEAGAPVSPARLVATTFSRKAAGEIRERIRHELQRLASEPDVSPYGATVREVLERLGLPNDNKALQSRAEAALSHLDEAFLGTLHAWAFQLVRAFPVESGLGDGVRIASESELESLSRVAFHDMVELAHARGEADELARAMSAVGGAAALRAAMARVLDTLTELGVTPASLCLPDELGALDTLERLLADAAASLDDKGAAALRAAFSSPSGATLTGLRWPSTKIARESVALTAFRRAMGGATLAQCVQRMAAARAHASHYGDACALARRWLCDMANCQADRMSEAAVASFGDVIARCRSMLLHHPAVAQEISARYDVLLLDEAQDMSRAQADVVSLLWHGGSAERAAGVLPALHEVRGRGLFVVGDRKQSIYGFRGADVAVFTEMCVSLAGEEARAAFGVALAAPARVSGRFFTIRPNFRSGPAILDFANAFSRVRFDLALPDDSDSETPRPDVRYVPETDDLEYPETAAPRPGPDVAWLRAEDKTLLVQGLAQAVAADVVERNVAPERIAVLAYRRSELGAVARALGAQGISSVQTARDFYAASVVRDAMAWLQVVVDPFDRMAALCMLRGPATGLLDDTLVVLSELRGRAPLLSSEALPGLVARGVSSDECARYARSCAAVESVARVAVHLSPYDALSLLARALDYDEVLAQLPDGAEQLANFRKLLREARRSTSIRDFVARVMLESDRGTAEEEGAASGGVAGSVQLMTVHASKGLDFDAVYVVHSVRRSRSDSHAWMLARGGGIALPTLFPRWVSLEGVYTPLSITRATAWAGQRRDDEDARKAYVAATRARDALTFVGLIPAERSASGPSVPSDQTALQRLAEAGLVRVRDLSDRDATQRSGAQRRGALPLLPRPSSTRGGWKHMQIAPTALGDFARCQRLFSLRHLLGATPRSAVPQRRSAPPSASGLSLPPVADAAQQGVVMHRVLEHLPASEFGAPCRETLEGLLAHEGLVPDDPTQPVVLSRLQSFLEGSYATECAREGVVLHRELPFMLALVDGDRCLELRGTADLVVERADGTIDIVDYKRGAGPHAELHAFQLGVYARAMRDKFPNAGRIRAGVAFLGQGEGEVRFVAESQLETESGRLLSLADALAESRASGVFSGQPIEHCRSLHCPYLATCFAEQGGG